MQLSRVALLLLGLVAVCLAVDLEVSVRLDKTEVIAGEPLTARVTILNPAPHDVTVLSWFTPLEGVRSDIFRLMHTETGRAAVYKGMIMKRQFPAPASAFTTLAAGEARHIELSLSDNYHFVSDGEHQISLAVAFHGFVGRTVAEQFDFEQELVSTAALLTVRHASVASLLASVAAKPQELHPDTISYIGCSGTQQTGIKNALPIAQSDSTQAYNYLTSAKCTGSYVTWFGVYNSNRYTTVKGNFQKIVSQLKSNNFKFDCNCDTDGVFAYVYPFDPTFTIHLCPAFWTAPTGSHQYNSRPGTLTHETSHFRAVAGTDDIQYGVLPCQRLASTSPADAIKNADSHEFFQESNPKC